LKAFLPSPFRICTFAYLHICTLFPLMSYLLSLFYLCVSLCQFFLSHRVKLQELINVEFIYTKPFKGIFQRFRHGENLQSSFNCFTSPNASLRSFCNECIFYFFLKYYFYFPISFTVNNMIQKLGVCFQKISSLDGSNQLFL
jgi:hypothetical protein